MKYFTYSRVSTENQSLLRQEKGIEDFCKENNIVIEEENKFSDKITGKIFKRDSYLEMKSLMQPGDALIILDLDRLGRNWDLIKQEWGWFTINNISIIVINMPLLNTTPEKDGSISLDKRLIQGIVFDLMCYLSQKEVEKVSQRTKEALQAKKELGVKLGRKEKELNYQQFAIDYSNRDISIMQIMEKYNITKPTVQNIVKKLGLEPRNKRKDK